MDYGLQLVLSSLGIALFNSIWQMGLLWFGLLLYSKCRGQLRPSALSNYSFIALVTGFLAFAATFLFVLNTAQTRSGFGFWGTHTHFLQLHSVIIYVAMVYIMLLIIPIFRLVLDIRHVHGFTSGPLNKVPGHYKIFLLNMAQYMGMKRKIKIYTSEKIRSPLTIGFLKPIILLPVAMLSQLSIQQVEAIIVHELAHIKRNDYLQNMITQIILVLFYFNPFAKMLANLQDVEREKSADRWVMRFQYSHSIYADALLHMARQNISKTGNLVVQASHAKTPLLERVQWIFGIRTRKYPSLQKIFAMLTLALFAVLILSINTEKATISSTNIQPVLNNAASPSFSLSHAVLSENNTTATTEADPRDEHHNIGFNKKEVVAKVSEKIPEKKAYTDQKTNEQPVEEYILPEEEITPLITYASTTVAPELSAEEEVKIREAMVSAKKVIAEISWKAIDHMLAETLAPDEKEILKEMYSQRIETSNWEKQENLLRQYYDQINWAETRKKFQLIFDRLRADSIYARGFHTATKESGRDVNDELPAEDRTLPALLEMPFPQPDTFRHNVIIDL